MTQEEYEERKRRLEEQHRAGIELLEAAHHQQLRALELIWMATAEGEPARPRVTTAPPSASPAPPPRLARRPAWQLFDDVATAFASLPEVFDRNHVCDAIGYEPDRGSLYRTLKQIIKDDAIEVAAPGTGKRPTRYRKTGRCAY
jgi:hypothetical protein